MRYVRVALCVFFFFFKQKTAYEMRISDWSSDVCSSDLRHALVIALRAATERAADVGRMYLDLLGMQAGFVDRDPIRLQSVLRRAPDLHRLIGHPYRCIQRLHCRVLAIRCRIDVVEGRGTAHRRDIADPATLPAAACYGQTGRAACRERVSQY